MAKVKKFEFSGYCSESELEADVKSFLNDLRLRSVPNLNIEYTYRFGNLQHVFVIFDEK